MSVLNNSLLLGADLGGYQIARSLRFNSSDSAYLSRTPSSAGNRKTWTWSGWVKYCSSEKIHFLRANPSSNEAALRLNNGSIQVYFNATTAGNLSTNAVFRDFSAWQHVVIAVDTTQATAANRVKVYINGTEQTLSGSYPAQNHDSGINTTSTHYICSANGSAEFANTYLADIHFIDGQALTPSSFAETNATTGQWVPKAYTGSYGTNGFKLDFADNSAATAAALGKDTSGNGNNWTPNNLSVTAGAGNDSLVDTPTSYGTDTGAGGEVRGNYATLNPLKTGTDYTLTNGDLDIAGTGGNLGSVCTFGLSSGKWYWEVTSTTASDDTIIGIVPESSKTTDAHPGVPGFGWRRLGNILISSGNITANNTPSSYTTGDILQFALDADAGKVWLGKNGSWTASANPAAGTNQTVTYTISAAPYFPVVRPYAGAVAVNFGQRPFAYTAPSGFKSLCDTNLPAPVVAKPSTVMDVVLYTGNGASTQTISGLNFESDLVWIKKRSAAEGHLLSDTVRGIEKGLYSNQTVAEDNFLQYGKVSAVSGTGFTVATTTDSPLLVNTNAATYVGWCWDAGSSTVTNTQGSITSQVRANASAGFSIVTYTSPNNGSNQTVGHGLGVKPGLILVKNRIASYNWDIYHSSLGFNASLIFTTAGTRSGAFGAEPTSAVFTTVNNYTHNSTDTYVAYCFAPVAGYSSAFSYSGSGSSDGPAIWLGFRPRLILIKRSDSTADWQLYDTARGSYNVVTQTLAANVSSGESGFTSGYDLDILSSGFKVRAAASNAINTSGGTYIGFAWAESPFQYARAR